MGRLGNMIKEKQASKIYTSNQNVLTLWKNLGNISCMYNLFPYALLGITSVCSQKV